MSRFDTPRRTILKGLGAGAAAAAFPAILRAQEKPTTAKAITLGAGDHEYEWVRNWAKLPAGMKLGNTHGCIATDSAGRILVNTDSDHAVLIFDPEGNYLGHWGKELKGGAHGMTVVKEGDKEFVYIAHTGRHQVIKATLEGAVQFALDYPAKSGAYKKADEYKPTSVAVSPDGHLYVGDGYGKSWVHHYNDKAQYVESWDGSKTPAGKMNQPHGVFIDLRGPAPILLVADRANSRILQFGLEGGKMIGPPIKVEGLKLPCHVHTHGKWLVIPDLDGRIIVIDKDNKQYATFGEQSDPRKRGKNPVPPNEWVDGEFIAPHCAMWDRKGDLYVMDWNSSGRLTKLKHIEPAPPPEKPVDEKKDAKPGEKKEEKPAEKKPEEKKP
jgi:DNA-binding beta-propeller fold protein YncE